MFTSYRPAKGHSIAVLTIRIVQHGVNRGTKIGAYIDLYRLTGVCQLCRSNIIDLMLYHGPPKLVWSRLDYMRFVKPRLARWTLS